MSPHPGSRAAAAVATPGGGAPDAADHDGGAALAAFAPMLDAISSLGLAELERALRLQIGPKAPTAAQLRVQMLGDLARMLNAEGIPPGPEQDWPAVPVIPRWRYDQARTTGADSERLVVLFGSWLAACRAAHGLTECGRTTGPGRPWAIRPSVRRRGARYDRDACLQAVRQCALALGRRPTPHTYAEWRRSVLALDANQHVDLPCFRTAIKPFKYSWRTLMAQLALADGELEAVRNQWLPLYEPAPESAGDCIASLTAQRLAELGLTATRARLLAGRGRRLQIPLSEAVRLAAGLDGSLAWLADLEESPGDPPSVATRFDPAGVLAQRDRQKLTDKRLREATGLLLGNWRKVMAGRAEPTLGQLVALAETLHADLASLLTDEEPRQ